MIYPFVDVDNKEESEVQAIPREYGIDFSTGQLTGRVVEGLEAVKVWTWLALQTQRYRYYIYSWDYGQEFEDLIGKGYSKDYTSTELKRMTEECLTVNPWITGIDEFTCIQEDERVKVSFKLITTLGDEEVNAIV